MALQQVNTIWCVGPEVKEWKIRPAMPHTIGLERAVRNE